MTQTSAADRKSIRAAQKAAAEVELRAQQVITNLMSSAAGREWVWGLLSRCSVFTQSATPEANWTYFNEGRRSVGSELLDAVMTACPDHFILAMREANERRIIELNAVAGGKQSSDRSDTDSNTGYTDRDATGDDAGDSARH